MIVGSIHHTKRSGDIEVLGYESYEKVHVKFLDTLNDTHCRADHIRKGEVRDKLRASVYGHGYFGYGKYTSTGEQKRAYKTWCGMLSRCYNEDFLSRNKTYVGCYVSDAWLCYQEFAEWYNNNYPSDGKNYDLDKDIKIDGNKLYGPDTCMFVTRANNASKAMGAHGEKWFLSDKLGQLFIVINQSEFSRVHGLNKSHLSSVLRGKRDSCGGFFLVDLEKILSML